jgi:pimeloyl-ACP methyl ester carboxylesterase
MRVFARVRECDARIDFTVVFVHGLIISARYMLPTAVQLASRHSVYLPDLPGFGRSAQPARVLNVPELADVLAEWMRREGLRRAALLGNSVGCQIIAEVAARYPDLVAAAVLVSPTVVPWRGPIQQAVRLLLDAPLERPTLWFEHFFDFLTAGPARSLRTFYFAMQHPMSEILPRVSAPTLVVRGSRDPIVSQAWAERVTRLLPRGHLRTIVGAPHAINYSAPTQLAEAVSDFLTPRWRG